MEATWITPSSIRELRDCVLDPAFDAILPVGSRTKSALTAQTDAEGKVAFLRSSGLQGVLDYQPSDFTITVRAGTRVQDVQQLLAEKGQFLPFDPPMVDHGCTIGGLVAAGWNGSSRMKWGGIRDFILAIEFIDGLGNAVRSGAPVVKNSAGYDLPKLFVGSYGRMGYLTEVSFKVFPRPNHFFTLRSEALDPAAAIEAMSSLCRACTDLVAIDWVDEQLWIRWHGSVEDHGIDSQKLATVAKLRSYDVIRGDEEAAWWRERSNPTISNDSHRLIKVACTRRSIVEIEKRIAPLKLHRSYCHAGNSCLVQTTDDNQEQVIERGLAAIGLPGIALIGSRSSRSFAASPATGGLADRIARSLDPHRRYSLPCPVKGIL